MLKLVTVFVLALAALPARATPVSLESLLERVEQDPAVLAAQSSYQADLEKQAMRSSETGPRAFMGLSTGHYRELNSGNQIDDYYSRNGNIGVSYPLLGSLKRQLDALAEAKLDAQRSQLAIAVRRAEQQLTVRTSYANWWRAQQETKVCESLLPVAGKSRKETANRLAAGWTRQSDAAELNQRWQAMQLRCERAQQQQQSERDVLELLAQMPLPNDARALTEPMYTQPAALGRWQQELENHPAVQDRAATLERAQEQRSQPWYTSIESSISLGLTGEDRSGVSRNGNSVVAALNFSIPIDAGNHIRASRAEAVNRWRAARDQLLAEKRRLMLELATVLRAHQQTVGALETRRSQVAAAQLRLREQRARLGLEDTTGLEQLQTAQLGYYQSQFDLIDTWHQLWLEQATLQLFVGNAQETTALLGSRTVAWPLNENDARARSANRSKPASVTSGYSSQNQSGWHYGVYVWNSHALLNAETRSQELASLERAGFKRMYVGLDAGQVQNMATTQRSLKQLVQEAKRRGLQTFLLLGEPLWITPEHRQDLVSLINSLAGVHFAGLHLDLEVEQLGWPVPETRVQHWLDTLDAAKRVSPWPLELSSHHRWFTQDAPTKICVPCKVQQLGARGVSLMIYTTNAQRSAGLAGDVADRWPGLQVRLAQSVEPMLADTESWALQPGAALQQALALWEQELLPAKVGGIDWQDWHYFSKQGLSLKQP